MNKKHTGFTLIELLITMSILSALIFTGTYSYQILASRWQKEVGTFNQTLEQAKGIDLLSRILNGIHPYIVINDQQQVSKPGFLFIGSESKLLSVTQQGLFSDKYPEIFRLTLQPNDNGKFDLIYQSVSTKEFSVFTANQEIEFQHSYLLLENIDTLSFSYIGWTNLDLMPLQKDNHETPKISPVFSGLDRQLLPINVIAKLKINSKIMSIEATTERNALQHITPYLGSAE
ncbi:prepilin-type N-terminal cleavage/methylation domain-containing protein [Pseudoalteromonas sp. TB64]|uniref:prepilin-type N-terminal cleavage/methylation domain-containing protein n=1 Tax=Pseudoalteromonas sp. TB64 TaxID=1938600 RepID=UPI0004662E27|nr:prepilin-type N-terminal cleavage/methylation domain-containing protein [Pseudoalteromonas sp. TB64]